MPDEVYGASYTYIKQVKGAVGQRLVLALIGYGSTSDHGAGPGWKTHVFQAWLENSCVQPGKHGWLNSVLILSGLALALIGPTWRTLALAGLGCPWPGLVLSTLP